MDEGGGRPRSLLTPKIAHTLYELKDLVPKGRLPWPDHEKPLATFELRASLDPDPDAFVWIVECRTRTEFTEYLRLVRERRQPAVLLAPSSMPPDELRAQPATRRHRLVARGPRVTESLVTSLARATESVLRFATYRALHHEWRAHAERLRDELAEHGVPPASEPHPERAPLDTTLWAHVHWFDGLLFPGPSKAPKHLGISPEKYRRIRRDLPPGIVAASTHEPDVEGSLPSAPDELRRGLQRAEAIVAALEDEQRAQGAGLVESNTPLNDLARQVIRDAIAAGEAVTQVARRLCICPERVRAHRDQDASPTAT